MRTEQGEKDREGRLGCWKRWRFGSGESGFVIYSVLPPYRYSPKPL